jgi:hypothetical protein
MHKRSNNTPHADARGAAVQIQLPVGARAGGRERYTATESVYSVRRDSH